MLNDTCYFLHSYVAICELEHTSSSTSVKKLALMSNFDIPAGAVKAYFAYCFRTPRFHFPSSGCGSALRVLLSYSKVAICKPQLEECVSRTTFILTCCDVRAFPGLHSALLDLKNTVNAKHATETYELSMFILLVLPSFPQAAGVHFAQQSRISFKVARATLQLKVRHSGCSGISILCTLS